MPMRLHMRQHHPYQRVTQGLGMPTRSGEQQGWLKQRRPHICRLRDAYRRRRPVDYNDPDLQEAYLLAYYPHYIELLFEVLASLENDCQAQLNRNEDLHACFFGAGPAPELVGLAAYCDEHCESVKTIERGAL